MTCDNNELDSSRLLYMALTDCMSSHNPVSHPLPSKNNHLLTQVANTTTNSTTSRSTMNEITQHHLCHPGSDTMEKAIVMSTWMTERFEFVQDV